ncbi:MAG: PepSY-associated TM helix domain-containing protein, partial [Ferrovibrionaceae bacterium]
PAPQLQVAEGALAYLQKHGASSPRWFINMPTERQPSADVLYLAAPAPGAASGDKPRRRFDRVSLDPATGEALSAARVTRGGEFFYRLHFDLHYMPALWARWIVGFCAMFMLVAIFSGIVTHKRIFKDFFTFRPKKGQRSWLDAHNVTAVLALPYHLMITYTGLVTLMFM